MSITSTSLSFTFVSMYAPPSAKQTAPTERCAPAETAPQHSCGESRPAGRPNRLVEAMMSALRELGFGNESNLPATPSTAPAPSAAGPVAAAMEQSAAAPATPVNADAIVSPNAAKPGEVAEAPQVSIESAVRQFAHELFGALRQVGRGESFDRGSDRGSDRVQGDGGRRHHHGHHGWRREGYGDMAQRLNALSQTFAAPAAASAAGASPVSTSVSITFTIQNGTAPQPLGLPGALPAQAETMSGAAGAGVSNADASQPTETPEVVSPLNAAPEGTSAPTSTAAAAPEATRNPLLDAFSQLFRALKPQAAQTDMADKLRSFLQTLAQAMRPDGVNQGNPMPQVGALVNVTA